MANAIKPRFQKLALYFWSGGVLVACVLNGFRGEVTSPQALWVLAVVSGCSAVICALLLWSAKFRQIVVEGEPEFVLQREEYILRGHGWIAFGDPRAQATELLEYYCE